MPTKLKISARVLLILVIMLFISCDQSDEILVTKIFSNATDVDLTIRVYSQNTEVETVSIGAHQDYTVSVKYSTDHTGQIARCSCPVDWMHADPILIEFSDSKVLTYCNEYFSGESCSINSKNIIYFPLYDYGYQNLGKNRYLFEITEEDYLAAQ
jgi:hypothetical protein